MKLSYNLNCIDKIEKINIRSNVSFIICCIVNIILPSIQNIANIMGMISTINDMVICYDNDNMAYVLDNNNVKYPIYPHNPKKLWNIINAPQ